jgi:hypothetical protein
MIVQTCPAGTMRFVERPAQNPCVGFELKMHGQPIAQLQRSNQSP